MMKHIIQVLVSKEDFQYIDSKRLEYCLKNRLEKIPSRSSFLRMVLFPALESLFKGSES